MGLLLKYKVIKLLSQRPEKFNEQYAKSIYTTQEYKVKIKVPSYLSYFDERAGCDCIRPTNTLPRL